MCASCCICACQGSNTWTGISRCALVSVSGWAHQHAAPRSMPAWVLTPATIVDTRCCGVLYGRTDCGARDRVLGGCATCWPTGKTMLSGGIAAERTLSSKHPLWTPNTQNLRPVASSAQAEPAGEGWCCCLAPLLLCMLSFIHVNACDLRHQQAKSAKSYHPDAVRCIVPA